MHGLTKTPLDPQSRNAKHHSPPHQSSPTPHARVVRVASDTETPRAPRTAKYLPPTRHTLRCAHELPSTAVSAPPRADIQTSPAQPTPPPASSSSAHRLLPR